MNALINRFISSIVQKLYRIDSLKHIRKQIKSILLDSSMSIESVMNNRSFNVFKDTHGNSFDLIEGLRDSVKPGWRWILQKDRKVLTKNELLTDVTWAKDAVKGSLGLLKAFDFDIKDKKVLEFGCGSSVKCHALKYFGARTVIGTDIVGYMPLIGDKGRKVSDEEHIRKISEKCRAYRSAFNIDDASENIKFQIDDMTNSSLDSSSFDLICSWGVLEHVPDMKSVFAETARVLKSGGMTFHEYNPFFSLNGGHSHCTLDFPWGHVTLDEEDFKRYLQENRPIEYDADIYVFKNSLNRMLFKDLKSYIDSSGLELVAFLPIHERKHIDLLANSNVFPAIKKIYPQITLDDLISPTVWVLCRKP